MTPDTRFRVFCMGRTPLPGTRATFCDWRGGYRLAESREGAEAKPCPRCGGPVTAVAA